MGLVFEAENAFAVLFEEQLKDFHCAHGDGNASSVIGFCDFSRNHDGTFVNPRAFHLNDFSDAHTGEAGKDEGSDHELAFKFGDFVFVPESGGFEAFNFVFGGDAFSVVFDDFDEYAVGGGLDDVTPFNGACEGGSDDGEASSDAGAFYGAMGVRGDFSDARADPLLKHPFSEVGDGDIADDSVFL